jgi:hypothetical protein
LIANIDCNPFGVDTSEEGADRDLRWPKPSASQRDRLTNNCRAERKQPIGVNATKENSNNVWHGMMIQANGVNKQSASTHERQLRN